MSITINRVINTEIALFYIATFIATFVKTFYDPERCMIALRSCFIIKGLLLNL